jgi:lipoic acid synthetase
MVMLPEWLSITPATTSKYNEIRETMRVMGTHTVCAEAHCPNTSECWSAGTATFMILGDVCTRGCRFCTVGKGASGTKVDEREPGKLARVIRKWGLKYAVLTSVCRDDLPDGGARHFAECISEIRKTVPETIIEILIPDFKGDSASLKTVVDAHPDVIAHNIETVARLSPAVRDRRASYRQSLDVLKGSKILDKSIYTKSAMMLGMGESEQEILSFFRGPEEGRN